MRRVLVLRPEPGASATAERARRRGLEPVAVPLFEIEAVAWEAPDARAFDGVLLTSANALRYGGAGLGAVRRLPVYAVGSATAEAARAAGFDIAAMGEAGVDQLVGSISAGLRLLHLCGEDRREPIGARQAITPLAVYRAREVPDPDLKTTAACVALVHSPRAARRLGGLVAATERPRIAIAAISPAAAEAAGSGWECVEAADQPNEDALLALAARLCNKPAAK